MPMTLTLSLSKKLTENFNSTALGVTIGAEVEHSVLADPAALQSRIDRLFAECDLAIERKLAAMSGGAAPMSLVGAAEAHTKATTPGVPVAASQLQLGHANGGNHGNGHSNGHANGHGGHATNGSAYGGMIRPATESQVRALRAICKRHRLDLDHEAHEEFGVEGADQLDVKQASALIDLLKDRVQAAPAAPGGRRWRP